MVEECRSLSITKNRQSQVSFSVIIPVFNNWVEAELAIASCLAQSYSRCEIILVNDGSSDTRQDFFDHARAFGIKIIINQVNKGPFFSRLNGVQEATGDYVIFLDADDSLQEGFMPRLNAFLACNKADIVTTNVSYGARQALEEYNFLKFFKQRSEAALVDGFSQWARIAGEERLGTGGKIYRRELLKKVIRTHGPVFANAELRYAEDVYLFFLCSLHANRFGYISDISYRITPRERSMTSSRESEQLAIKKLLIREVLLLMKASATLAPHSNLVVFDFFQSQLLVDYHLMERWNAKSRFDGFYVKALWEAYKQRGTLRDMLRLVFGSLSYLVLGRLL